MTSVVVSIFFRGLIAFVHNRPQNNAMTAYAINDQNHKTVIVFKSTSVACPKYSSSYVDCDFESVQGNGWCACNITDLADVKLVPQPLFPKNSIADKPSEIRPFNTGKAASELSWLVRMKNIDHNASQAEDVSDYVRAQLSFGWNQTSQACHLDQAQDDECTANCDFNIYPHRFINHISKASGYEQALAEEVRFDVPFDKEEVSIMISKRGDKSGVTLDLGCTGGKCPDVLFLNGVVKEDCSDDDSLQDVGSHFPMYYRLAKASGLKKQFPMRLREDVVPLDVGKEQLTNCTEDPFLERYEIAHRRSAAPGLFKILDDVVILGYQTRIICPMALFDK